MRFSPLLLLPFLGSVSALPVSGDALNLAQRAPVTGPPPITGPTINVTYCQIRIKAELGWHFHDFDRPGEMWIVHGGIPAAGTQNGQNPVDVLVRAPGYGPIGTGAPVKNNGIAGSLQFVSNAYLLDPPGLYDRTPRASVDYAVVKGNRTKFVATLDGANVAIVKQIQAFVTSWEADKPFTYEPAVTTPWSEGWVSITLTDTGNPSWTEVSGGLWAKYNVSPFTPSGFEVARVSGTCGKMNQTLPLNLAA
ncbi:hypothetical protein ACHAPT_004465 [Fusarium lateritium]